MASADQAKTKSSKTLKPSPKMPQRDIEEAFRRLAEIMPAPRTELQFSNPYTLLVAVALSAQATDVSVNKATGPLFSRVSTPAAMLQLGEEGLKTYIRSIGLFNTKARNIIRMAEILIEKHDGIVPRDRKALEALPGVGRKTANVVLNEAFGEPTLAVDTHIFRVGNRTGMAVAPTPLGVEKLLLKRVPKTYLKAAHHWLILHGRYRCMARKPDCNSCVIHDLCRFRAKTTM